MSEFIMMIGIPASGKSARAKEIAEEKSAIVLSSDEIRHELFGDENDQTDNERVFNELHSRIIGFLKMGYNVIYDACNVNRRQRTAFLKQINKYCDKKICEVMYKPYELCVEENNARERNVPAWAIRKMLLSFYFPHKFEGWDEIHMNNAEKYLTTNENFNNLFCGENGLHLIPHDNPHHSMTIGDHCVATCFNTVLFEYNTVEGWSENLNNLAVAALFHDIGKPFTKSFKNNKGEITETAHYYQHHLVSAYLTVPYIYQKESVSDDDLWEILALIDYHMHPYFWEKDNNTKMMNKYRKLWGDKLFENIMKLHKADDAAH